MSILRITVCGGLLALSCQVFATEKSISNSPICLIQGTPANVDFKTVKRIKVGKGTYGSVEDVYPTVKYIANRYQADAIINYNGSQRFGFWPWRIVRPVITGVAVKFNTPTDCASLNGKLI